LLNLVVEEINRIENVESHDLLVYHSILRKIVDSFIEYEKTAIDTINIDFMEIDETITNFLKNDLELFIEDINALFKEKNIEIQIGEQLQEYLQIPKRRWEGPINLKFLADFRGDFDKEKVKLEKEQFQRIKEFINRSMSSYGGIILEIINLINNKRTILEIIAYQSLVEGRIPQIQSTLDFIKYLKNHNLIDFAR